MKLTITEGKYLTREIDKQLLDASAAGDITTVQRALAEGADIKAKDAKGKMAVHLAAISGQDAIVKFFLDEGIPVDVLGGWGGTALMVAANVAVADLLIARGANINSKDNDGDMAIHEAALKGWDVMVRFWLDKGMPVDVIGQQGMTPLIMAAWKGHVAAVAVLVAAGANVNADDKDEDTPLTLAASEGHTSAIAPLVAAGANVNAVNKDGASAIMLAALRGHTSAIAALLAAGADVTRSDGTIALILAAMNGHAEAITALCSAGADVNAVQVDEGTALMLAAMNGHVSAITALITAGANVNATRIDGTTALMLAAQDGHAAAIAALITAGANVNAVRAYGTTALMLAAYGGHVSAITALITAGANVNAAREGGMTALMYAAENGHAEAITALHAAGANANASTGMLGSTALMMAVKNGHAAAVEALHAAGAKDESRCAVMCIHHIVYDNPLLNSDFGTQLLRKAHALGGIGLYNTVLDFGLRNKDVDAKYLLHAINQRLDGLEVSQQEASQQASDQIPEARKQTDVPTLRLQPALIEPFLNFMQQAAQSAKNLLWNLGQLQDAAQILLNKILDAAEVGQQTTANTIMTMLLLDHVDALNSADPFGSFGMPWRGDPHGDGHDGGWGGGDGDADAGEPAAGANHGMPQMPLMGAGGQGNESLGEER